MVAHRQRMMEVHRYYSVWKKDLESTTLHSGVGLASIPSGAIASTSCYPINLPPSVSGVMELPSGVHYNDYDPPRYPYSVISPGVSMVISPSDVTLPSMVPIGYTRRGEGSSFAGLVQGGRSGADLVGIGHYGSEDRRGHYPQCQVQGRSEDFQYLPHSYSSYSYSNPYTLGSEYDNRGYDREGSEVTTGWCEEPWYRYDHAGRYCQTSEIGDDQDDQSQISSQVHFTEFVPQGYYQNNGQGSYHAQLPIIRYGGSEDRTIDHTGQRNGQAQEHERMPFTDRRSGRNGGRGGFRKMSVGRGRGYGGHNRSMSFSSVSRGYNHRDTREPRDSAVPRERGRGSEREQEDDTREGRIRIRPPSRYDPARVRQNYHHRRGSTRSGPSPSGLKPPRSYDGDEQSRERTEGSYRGRYYPFSIPSIGDDRPRPSLKSYHQPHPHIYPHHRTGPKHIARYSSPTPSTITNPYESHHSLPHPRSHLPLPPPRRPLHARRLPQLHHTSLAHPNRSRIINDENHDPRQYYTPSRSKPLPNARHSRGSPPTFQESSSSPQNQNRVPGSLTRLPTLLSNQDAFSTPILASTPKLKKGKSRISPPQTQTPATPTPRPINGPSSLSLSGFAAEDHTSPVDQGTPLIDTLKSKKDKKKRKGRKSAVGKVEEAEKGVELQKKKGIERSISVATKERERTVLGVSTNTIGAKINPGVHVDLD